MSILFISSTTKCCFSKTHYISYRSNLSVVHRQNGVDHPQRQAPTESSCVNEPDAAGGQGHEDPAEEEWEGGAEQAPLATDG